MVVYREYEKIESFPFFLVRKDEALLFCAGIHIRGRTIEPLYLIRIWRTPGYLHVQFKGKLIVLSRYGVKVANELL